MQDAGHRLCSLISSKREEFYLSEGDMLGLVASEKWISNICFPESNPGKNSGFE